MAGSYLNLFFALVGAAVTAFLGLIVYFHERKSWTNIIFVIHSFIGVLWSVATYFSIVASPDTALFWIRGVIFFAVPHVFLFFMFVSNFPSVALQINKVVLLVSTLLMGGMMFLTTTPYVFKSVKIVNDQILPVPGLLITLFGPTLVFFFLLTIVLVFVKYFHSQGLVRRQWASIGTGLVVAYTLLIFFVFLRVILFEDTRFVLYSPLFILPIFIGAAYAVLRHNLFNVKVVAAEMLTFALVVVSLVQVFLAEGASSLILGLLASIGSLYFGILLIKSVLSEVRQREKLQELTEKLQAANTQLEDLSRFKTQLLSLASHQVKSPLAAIKGYTSIILEGLYGPVTDKVKAVLEKMKFSTNELIKLVDTLLDLRKVEEGKMEYKFEKVSLVKIAMEAVQELVPLALQKKLSLQFLPPRENVFVQADAQKLKQVFQNLVDNAIKYTPSGFVKMDMREEPGTDFVVVTVSDSGLGLPQDLIPHLFEEFVRDERVKKEIRGTGFGLYIARKIAEAHGGTMQAASEGEGKGSMFTVRLPRAK